jgi:sec-independent protein translocase protein TatA
MGGLGAPEIILIIIAILILFGGKKIPELMKGLGKGMKEFKDAQNGEANSTTSSTTSGPTHNTDEKPRV